MLNVVSELLKEFKGFQNGDMRAETNRSLKNIYFIFQKELQVYFNSPVAYIVIIAFLLIAGWFFSSQVFLSKQATVEYFLSNIPLLFVFIIPAVSMRLFAEEQKAGTIKILATLPLRDFEIILGKYLAAVALIIVAVLSTLVHPVTLSFLGNVDWGQVFGSYLGLVLLSASFMAIGLFASSMTRNQIVSFIIGLVICFALFVVGKILMLVPSFLVTFVEYAGIDSHFENISKGLIDSRDLIYYASIIVFFLYATYLTVSSRKESKKLQIRVYSSSTIALMLGVLIAANYLSFYLFARVDLSQGRIYSLSKASKKLVSTLSDPLIIKAYFTKNLPSPYNTQSKYLEDLLSEYKAYSKGKIKYSFIDPGEKEETKQEVNAIGIPPLRFTDIEKDKYEIKEGYMGLVFINGDKKEVIPLVKETNGLEYDISSIIKKLVSTNRRKVGFLSGHNEIDVTASQGLYTMLSSQYDVSNVDLKANADALKDVDTLLVLGPKSEISEDESFKIDQFLMKGKTAAFFLDKNNVDMRMFIPYPIKTGLDDMLKTYGVKIEDGYVIDRQNQTVGVTQRQGMFQMVNYVNYPLVPIVTRLSKESVIVKGLEALVVPFVSPVAIVKDPKDTKKRIEILAESSEYSWLKNNLRSLSPMERYTLDSSEKKGPFPLIVTVEGAFESAFPAKTDAVKASAPSRILVAGTSRMIETEEQNSMSPNFNFFMNAIDWLVQDEALISIRSKGVVIRPLKEVQSAGARTLIKYFNILFMPVVFILYGLIRQRLRAFKKKQIELAYQ